MLTSNAKSERGLSSHRTNRESKGREEELLQIAAEGSLEELQQLLSAQGFLQRLFRMGLDLDVQDGGGDTPLHWAARRGKVALVEELLRHGASVDRCNRRGDTPLLVAVEEGHLEVVSCLLRYGAQVTLRDREGYSALHRAARSKKMATSAQIAALLLKAGVDPNVRCLRQETPLHICAQYENVSMAHELLHRGADPEAQDNQQRTPLDHARERGNFMIADLLSMHKQKASPAQD